MSNQSGKFKKRLLDIFISYAAKIETALDNNDYILVLDYLCKFIDVLNDVKPIIEATADAQKTGDDFDIMCHDETAEDNPDPLLAPDGDSKKQDAGFGTFPKLFPSNDHGPN